MMNTDNNTRPARNGKKNKNSPRIILIVLLSLVLIALVGLMLAARLLNRIQRPEATPAAATATPVPSASPSPAPADGDMPAASPLATPVPTPLPLSEVYNQTLLTDADYARMDEENQNTRQFHNILLLGVDRRGSSGNSSADTMMIATLDVAHGRLKLSSLLRDMLVEVPGRDKYEKLNSANTYGGVELLMQTINKNFRLGLSEYVLVDFNMFIDIIDRMDGVTISMSTEEISAANDCIAGLNKQWGIDYLWDGFIFAEAGNVKCTGKQALGYARIRHLDSDFKRTNRQYKVLSAVYAKFRKLSPTKQYELMYELLPYIETNMTNEAIVQSAVQALSIDASGILQFHAPIDDSYESGKYERRSVLLTDITKNALALHDFIYQNADAAEEAKVLTPGASLPPRTPRPVIPVQDANGNIIYYYEDGSLVPGQDLIYPGGDPNAVYPGAVYPGAVPVQTPWQSLGDQAQ